MTQSSLTEETPATPGWVDSRIAELFAPLGPQARPVQDNYANCLAGVRGAADIDTARDACRQAAVQALREILPDADAFDRRLQALEAEIASAT